jgi:3-hydroxymyristoyl/3-hydroxydecanoyl-(acyl carrier protein) dehydratase
MWHEFTYLRQSDLNEITAGIRVPPDSPWFCGHFPGEPILPGIAQLGMVFEAINQYGDRNLTIATISRVRFKQMIRPNQQLRIIATPRRGQTESYAFRVMVEEETVCSGVMTVARRRHGADSLNTSEFSELI